MSSLGGRVMEKKRSEHGGDSMGDGNLTTQTMSQHLQGPEIWKRVCAKLRGLLDVTEYDKWLATLRFLAEIDGSVLIVAKTKFACDRVNADYKRQIQRIWKDIDPKSRPVRLECWATMAEELRGLFGDPWADQSREPAVREVTTPEAGTSPVNLMGPSVMRFETLITGKSNRVAAKVAQGIAAGGDQVPASVIVINGSQGVGKTHILKALEGRLEMSGQQKVAYISAEEFVVAYVEGATTGDTRALKKRVRQADVVLFDDLQNIAGKKGTNNELTGAIRTVSERGGTIILTADRSPADMEGLSQGVMTVLKGAACIEIAMPDEDMRRSIVAQRARMLAACAPNFVLDDEMQDAIVARVQGPGRDLCGAVVSLFTETGLGEVAPTMKMLDRVLSRKQKPRRVTMDTVKRAVCKVYDMTRTDLEGERKFQRFVRARQVGMYLAREMTEKSFPQIGISFGKRHHTTALYAWRKIKKNLDASPELRADVEQVRQAIAHLQASLG